MISATLRSAIKGQPGTAKRQWETCTGNACKPAMGATGPGYEIPARTKAGTTIRAALTITPTGQTGPIQARTQKVTIVTEPFAFAGHQGKTWNGQITLNGRELADFQRALCIVVAHDTSTATALAPATPTGIVRSPIALVELVLS